MAFGGLLLLEWQCKREGTLRQGEIFRLLVANSRALRSALFGDRPRLSSRQALGGNPQGHGRFSLSVPLPGGWTRTTATQGRRRDTGGSCYQLGDSTFSEQTFFFTLPFGPGDRRGLKSGAPESMV